MHIQGSKIPIKTFKNTRLTFKGSWGDRGEDVGNINTPIVPKQTSMMGRLQLFLFQVGELSTVVTKIARPNITEQMPKMPKLVMIQVIRLLPKLGSFPPPLFYYWGFRCSGTENPGFDYRPVTQFWKLTLIFDDGGCDFDSSSKRMGGK